MCVGVCGKVGVAGVGVGHSHALPAQHLSPSRVCNYKAETTAPGASFKLWLFDDVSKFTIFIVVVLSTVTFGKELKILQTQNLRCILISHLWEYH